MANYATLKAAIQDVIKTNGNNEITGALLQQSLLAMINSLGYGYQYMGLATPTTNPGTPDQNVFYLASTAGTYTNFDALVLTDGEIAILKYNGAWSKDSTGAASLEKVNQLGQGLAGAQSNIEKLEGNFEDVVGKNLFDKDQQVGIGYINLYGNITDTTGENYTYSYKIPIEENTYYYLTRSISGNANIRCLDGNGDAMRVLIASTGTTRSDWALPNESGTSGAASGQFKTPEGAVFVQFNIRWNGIGDVDGVMLSKIGTEYIPSYPAPEYEQYEKSYKLKESALPADFKDSILSQLKGKTICIFGGSVSRLCSTFGGASVMESMSGVSIINKGQDGGGYAKGTTIVDGTPVFASGGICDNVNQATQNGQPVYDIYLLWSSTNDLYVTPGDVTDYSFVDNYDVDKLTTQCGGMNYCIKKLQEFAPESRIIVIGSMEAVGFTYISDFNRLQTLVEKQEAVAKFQSLPFFSLWANSGANYYNRDAFFQWTVENEGESRNDGTHPNKWAYKTVIGPKLIKQIALLW